MKKKDLMERAKKQAQDSNQLINKLVERNIDESIEEERCLCYVTPWNMEIIKFFFCDFWHFIGLCLIISIVGDVLLDIFNKNERWNVNIL